MRNLFLQKLQAEGFQAIEALDGLVGIQRTLEDLPNLIISEIRIPRLDGYGVLRRLRQHPATMVIPFIFVTEKKSLADMRKGMEFGADDYIIKPCNWEVLLRAITTRLQRQTALRQFYAAQFQSVPEAPFAETTNLVTSNSIFPSDPQLDQVFHFIEANYYQPITLNDVAIAVGYSPTYLTHLVRTQTGLTVQKWIILRRMMAARSLLLETDEKVEKIAIKIGYNCMVHFFRQFRQYHGTTPQAWRESQLVHHK